MNEDACPAFVYKQMAQSGGAKEKALTNDEQRIYLLLQKLPS